jgi:hypothetical protein
MRTKSVWLFLSSALVLAALEFFYTQFLRPTVVILPFTNPACEPKGAFSELGGWRLFKTKPNFLGMLHLSVLWEELVSSWSAFVCTRAANLPRTLDGTITRYVLQW